MINFGSVLSWENMHPLFALKEVMSYCDPDIVFSTVSLTTHVHMN